MALETYRNKRDFTETPEPAGRKDSRTGRPPLFVVQRHSASRLHYDFRLEIGGVLASWAVPKGPSMRTADKRLAVRTEDHPLDYASFEGVIPEGHYGAGTVMVWDLGPYAIEGDAPAGRQLAEGELKIVLAGKKLRGSFVLIRSDDKRWLLIKRRDQYAQRSWDIESLTKSALTGRTMDQIARSAKRPASQAARTRRKRAG
jgi:bifunctional non-homologous end joining protein LigD